MARTTCSQILGTVLLAGLALQVGCTFNEGGSGIALDEYTYVSRPHTPKTVSVVDTRTEQVIFTMDVPVGQQLVMDFDDPDSREGEYLSGEMRWALMPAGYTNAQLRNRVNVPPPESRRIDMELREGPELATLPPTAGG